MNEPTTDPAAETEDASPSAPSSRRWLRNLILWAFASTSGIALALMWVGVIGEVGFWRIVTFTTIGLGIIVMRQNTELLHDCDRWEALSSDMLRTLQGIRMRPAVRCAGCHDTAMLMTHEPDEDGNVPLPPGWRMQNGRPYCDECLASRE